MDEGLSRDHAAGRIANTLDRIEIIYLRILRASVLIIATILVAVAIGYAGINLVKVMRSTSSVVESPVKVDAADLIPEDGKAVADTSKRDQDNRVNAQRRAFYDNFVKRYFSVYQRRFASFKRSEDKMLSQGEFDDLTIDTSARLDAIRGGDLEFSEDRSNLEALLTAITAAAADPRTVARLNRYKTAKKSRIATEVQRTRTETRRGWDPYASNCTGWYEAPIGCPVNRQVEVPYTAKSYEMRFPVDVEAPSKIFKGYQDRFFTILNERRGQSVENANTQRSAILTGQEQGRAGLVTALGIGGGFVVLMFFFLLIAIERHQRRLSNARMVAQDGVAF